ncbi:LysR family transcriptional regulator [Micromonospora fluostatini]|uniref:LysR family transcriptional regulator n=1 Tax=Micromonospora sp. JCM 30529 TaxID=3421643 RepID=UPI003D172CF3
MDLDGVRTFVLAAELGQFQEAADELAVTQQAVSKRVAALEQAVGAVLFARTTRGVRLTLDGQTFLPHARELLRAAERARNAVRPGSRALRVDVTHRRIAPAVALHDFHVAHPDQDLDVVTLAENNLTAALAAVRTGAVDASFRAVTLPADTLPAGISTARAIDHELEVLLGPRHPLAREQHLEPARLAGHRIWIPGIVPGTEWATFYHDFADAFGLSIDGIGPHFGDEALLDQLSTSADLATIVGRRDRYLWPARYDLRRIPLRNPTPIYPHSLIWATANPHPGLAALRAYLSAARHARTPAAPLWTPAWTTPDHGGLQS